MSFNKRRAVNYLPETKNDLKQQEPTPTSWLEFRHIFQASYRLLCLYLVCGFLPAMIIAGILLLSVFGSSIKLTIFTGVGSLFIISFFMLLGSIWHHANVCEKTGLPGFIEYAQFRDQQHIDSLRDCQHFFYKLVPTVTKIITSPFTCIENK